MIGPLSTLLAYFLGSIPFGFLIVRWQKGIDVRTTGSGSIGATNVMRNLGLLGFTATLILDAGKGLAAVLLAGKLASHDPRWVAAAAVAAIVGHCFPVWLKFRGGKGVATAVGVYLALAPLQILIVLGLFAVVVGIWRYISLGSIIAAATFPALIYFMKQAPTPIVLGTAVAAVIIIVKHHANIRRLWNGTENRVGKKKSEVSGQ
jgi:glycerol-3-phosphate acyltransferase PlsY